MTKTNKKTYTEGYIAVLLGLVTALIWYVFHQESIHLSVLTGALVAGLTVGIVSYWGIKIWIKRRYESRLEEVYRTLLGEDSAPRGTRAPMDGDILDQIMVLVQQNVEKEKGEIARLEKLESYRKVFLGNVSHELKTPAFNIQGYIETLLDGGLEDKKINRKYLKRTAKNIKRLNAIIDDLTFIAQSDHAMLQLSLQSHNLTALIEEVIDALEIRAEEAGILLELSGDAPERIMVEMDREKIEQVLTNLLSNSIKYGKEGGKTTISVEEKERSVTVIVADNGIGIEEQHLPRLFERFYRVDTARSRKKGGTGLGLSIVKHIIEAHGQTIWVESAPGQGTSFYFTLRKEHREA